MSNNVVVLGVQWGDEGKGKVVDALAEHFDIVVRYQGGANAGHTVVIDGKKFILQLIPTGILHPDKTAVIGNGVVVDPEALLREVEAIEASGIAVGNRLLISDRAHLILPYHRAYDLASEKARGTSKIGTTAKGIGPAYETKVARRGLRACDLRSHDLFVRKWHELAGDSENADGAEAELERFFLNARRIVPYLADVSAYLNSEMDRGKGVLFEGAQGTMLDVDHGTYPFVTSSNASAGGASTGTGVGPTRINAVIGVSKAYATRVGSGPFPTESTGAEGEELRRRGGEYGAVTGRPRRCGWFDVPAARYSVRLNNLSALVITKLDILDHLAEIPVGIEYELDGKPLSQFPPEIEVLERVKLRYEVLPGWQQSTYGLRDYAQLPQQAKGYLRYLESQVGTEITMISTGPQRDQTIWLNDSRFANLVMAAS